MTSIYVFKFILSWFLGEIKRLISFFCMWISSFSNTIYWRDCVFLFVSSWYLSVKNQLTWNACIWFWVIPLLQLFSANTMHFVIMTCGIFWSLAVWCLQLYSFWSRLLSLFVILLWFHMNFRIFSIFMKNYIVFLKGFVLNV